MAGVINYLARVGVNPAVGDKSEHVADLQTHLNIIGRYGLTVDGIFGTKTLNAVKSYQDDKGISGKVTSGVVGNLTKDTIYKDLMGKGYSFPNSVLAPEEIRQRFYSPSAPTDTEPNSSLTTTNTTGATNPILPLPEITSVVSENGVVKLYTGFFLIAAGFYYLFKKQ